MDGPIIAGQLEAATIFLESEDNEGKEGRLAASSWRGLAKTLGALS